MNNVPKGTHTDKHKFLEYYRIDKPNHVLFIEKLSEIKNFASGRNYKCILDMIKFRPNEDGEILYSDYMKYKSMNRSVTLYKMTLRYGKEEGTRRFDEYRERQAYTNTLEYKRNKYGMSNEEFKQYNLSRAVTLENLIKRHGKEEGTRRFDEYRERQAYTNTLEYFKEIYGENANKKWLEYNSKKANTLENYINRHGDEKGRQEYIKYVSEKSISGFSKSSNMFFKKLEYALNSIGIFNNIYYAIKNKEYGIMFDKSYFKYDFVDTDIGLVIEFNGDDWHANPKIYKPDDTPKVRNSIKKTAKEIWDYDAIKNSAIVKDRGFDLLVLWESEVKNNEENMIEIIINEYYKNI